MKISNYFAKEKMDDATFIQTFIEKLNELKNSFVIKLIQIKKMDDLHKNFQFNFKYFNISSLINLFLKDENSVVTSLKPDKKNNPGLLMLNKIIEKNCHHTVDDFYLNIKRGLFYVTNNTSKKHTKYLVKKHMFDNPLQHKLKNWLQQEREDKLKKELSRVFKKIEHERAEQEKKELEIKRIEKIMEFPPFDLLQLVA